MAVNKLFAARVGWETTELPSPMTNCKARSRETSAIHALNDKGFSTIHRDVIRAVLNYTGLQVGTDHNYLYGDFAVTKVSNSLYAAERALENGNHEVVTYNTNGDLKAAVITTTGQYTPFPTLGGRDDNIDCSTIFLAILPVLIQEDSEVESIINVKAPTFGCLDTEQYYLISDAMYQQINKGVLKVNIPSDGNIDLLAKTTVSAGTFAGETLAGNPDILLGNSGKKRAKSSKMTIKDAKKEFLAFAKTHTWTDSEKDLIPSFPDDFPVPPEALRMARRYVGTKDDIRPMCNFMWRGITSYGKSTGVEVMAAILDMPLLRVTCHSNMETQQFLSDFVPDTTDSCTTDNLPDFESIQFDPEGAYFELTGIEDENATQDMCLKAYGEAVAKQNASTPRFKHVESNFIKALRNGYIVEIQECSRIKDSGVLVGLNEYDRPGAIIPLIDGSYAKRHKDAMVVYTDNVGYVSCRPIDPSVIRRMAFVIDSYEMPKEQVISRVKYNTKYSDDNIIDTCYDIWHDLQEFAKDHDITEGSISVTELEMLVQCIKCDGLTNVRDKVIECIISKATSDIDEQEQLKGSLDVNSGKYGII